MKKISILFIAAVAMISCGNTYTVKSVALADKMDSLNYAYGCGYGNYILQAALQGEATPEVINEFIQAIEDGYNDKVPTLSQIETVGMNVGQSVKSFEKKGLMEISAWRVNEKLIFQGLVNGLNQDTVNIKRDEAMEYINAQMRGARDLEEVDVQKAIKGKCKNKVANVTLNTLNDSINYIFGFLNGEDIFAGLISRDSDIVAATNEFIESVNKGLKTSYENPQLVNDGHMMGKQFKTSETDGFMGMANIPFKYDILLQGLVNGLNQDTVMMNGDFATTYLQATMQEVQAEAAKADNQERMDKEAAFLAENAQREEVTVTESGLQYEVIKMGKGQKPVATDRVRVHYHGTLLDGTVFDSSVDRGEPASLGLNQVIPGWTEGVQLMPIGSKFKFYIPYQLGYGERAAGSIPPYSMLIFEVELLDIEK